MKNKFICKRAFRKKDDNCGVMISVKEGEDLELLNPDEILDLLEAGNVVPADLPERGKYICQTRLDFWENGVRGGVLLRYSRGEVVTIGADEAMALMMRHLVKPVDPNRFYPGDLKRTPYVAPRTHTGFDGPQRVDNNDGGTYAR